MNDAASAYIELIKTMLDPVPDLPAGEPGVKDTDEMYLVSLTRGTVVRHLGTFDLQP